MSEYFSNLAFCIWPSNGKTWNRLRQFSLQVDADDCLSFGYFHDESLVDPGGLPCSFLQDAAGSLECLEFSGIPVEWYDSEGTFIPFLPKLKMLRINNADKFSSYERYPTVPFPIYPLAVAFPRLEQLAIGPDIPHLDPEPVSIWRDKRDDIWPHLKVLIFEVMCSEKPSHNTARTRSALRCLTCLNRGNSLQHINLEFYWGWSERDIFSGGDDLLPDSDIVQDAEFKNLRSFRSRTLSITPEGARNLLSKAVQTNQLTCFNIVFPLWSSRSDRDVEERLADHLKGYDWVRGAPSIQSLGCYNLRLHRTPKNDQDHFVAHFLATFPNLRTLSVVCDYDDIDDYASLLVEILRFTHLETMYMKRVDHEACAQLRQAARAQGVQLMDLPNLYPPIPGISTEFPVSLGG